MSNTTDATKPCRNHPHHCPGCGREIECGYVCCATCTPDTPAPSLIRHASRTSERHSAPLCGMVVGQTTAPKESVNCPECRVILNHVRNNYPAHAVYTDWRLTPAQARKAVDRMVADMHGGADD